MSAAACLGQDPYRVSPPALALVRGGPPPGAGRPAGQIALNPAAIARAFHLTAIPPRSMVASERERQATLKGGGAANEDDSGNRPRACAEHGTNEGGL